MSIQIIDLTLESGQTVVLQLEPIAVTEIQVAASIGEVGPPGPIGPEGPVGPIGIETNIGKITAGGSTPPDDPNLYDIWLDVN